MAKIRIFLTLILKAKTCLTSVFRKLHLYSSSQIDSGESVQFLIPSITTFSATLENLFMFMFPYFLIFETWLILQSDHRTGVWSAAPSQTLPLSSPKLFSFADSIWTFVQNAHLVSCENLQHLNNSFLSLSLIRVPIASCSIHTKFRLNTPQRLREVSKTTETVF